MPRPASPPSAIAPIERLDEVYRGLQRVGSLGHLDEHALLARGFTAEEIRQRGYWTLPLSGRARLPRQLHQEHIQLDGIPGLWVNTQSWGEFWTLAGAPGLVIPCRDLQGRIRGLRLRPHTQGSGGKYRWFSSAGRPRGTACRACCHVARPLSGEASDQPVWVVEGEIKADLAAERLGAVVVSIPGVNSWSLAIPEIAALLPNGGQVVVAMDADWRKNSAVHEAMWCLAQAAKAAGHEVQIATWKPIHKGVDDLLTAGMKPELTEPGSIPMPEWTLKLSSRQLIDLPPRTELTGISLAAMRHRLPEALASISRLW